MVRRVAIRADVLDWMRHGTMLCELRVAKWPEHEPDDMRRVFERELKIRRFVMDWLHVNERLAGSARVWFEYMVQKAVLQVSYADKAIDEVSFRERSRRLRVERDRDDRKRQHDLWMRQVAA